LGVIANQTWFRLEEFVRIAFPLMIVGNQVLKTLQFFNLLSVFDNAFSFITVSWLGLPPITLTPLIFGILLKELTLVMLAALVGTSNFATILTGTQMIVYATVIMLYIPCLATIAVLARQFGYKRALTVTLFEAGFAVGQGGRWGGGKDIFRNFSARRLLRCFSGVRNPCHDRRLRIHSRLRRRCMNPARIILAHRRKFGVYYGWRK
jgi:hypothetical protein